MQPIGSSTQVQLPRDVWNWQKNVLGELFAAGLYDQLRPETTSHSDPDVDIPRPRAQACMIILQSLPPAIWADPMMKIVRDMLFAFLPPADILKSTVGILQAMIDRNAVSGGCRFMYDG